MNLIAAKDSLLFFVSQWMGTTVPRLLAVFVGIVVIIRICQRLWELRSGWTISIIGILAASLLAGMGIEPAILHALTQLEDPVRLRLTLGILSAVVIGINFESIRRARLEERYALLWMVTGLLVMMGAIFPDTVEVLGSIFGANYLSTVVGVLFAFLLLVAFHFSLSLSRHESRHRRLAQRCVELERRLELLETGESAPVRASAAPIPPLTAEEAARKERAARLRAGLRFPGAAVAIPLLIALAVFVNLVVGLRGDGPMVGDEVTHYFMAVEQSKDLSEPNFRSPIPTGWGKVETRNYPHVNAWHYLAGVVYRISGGSLGAVQFFHTLFWVQFLVASALLARRRCPSKRSYSPLLFVILMASLPSSILFSVAFYQDVPAMAQVVSAFVALMSGHWILGSVFLMFAISIKVNSFLFIPAFMLLLLYRSVRPVTSSGGSSRIPFRTAMPVMARRLAVFMVLMIGLSVFWNHHLSAQVNARFYPVEKVMQITSGFQHALGLSGADDGEKLSPAGGLAISNRKQTEHHKFNPIIANHPGDLRIPKNFLLYFGGLVWGVMLLGGGRRLYELAARMPRASRSTGWLFLVALSYIVPAAVLLRTCPDARFFLSAVPFLVLPFVEWMVRIGRVKWIVAFLMACAVLQAGMVYNKVDALRQLSPETEEVIAFLQEHPPEPALVFMYPEGHYRLFPVEHTWYLNYRLRQFWRTDNDGRIGFLNHYDCGYLVIKKYLVASVDAAITDLGVYPSYFVKEIREDPRFSLLFENAEYLVYAYPDEPAFAPRPAEIPKRR